MNVTVNPKNYAVLGEYGVTVSQFQQPNTSQLSIHIREARSKRAFSLSPQICAFKTQVWGVLLWFMFDILGQYLVSRLDI